MVLQIVPATIAQEKHFGDVHANGMQSAIGRKAGKPRAGIAAVVGKELRRASHKAGQFFVRLPCRLNGSRKTMRVTFADSTGK